MKKVMLGAAVCAMVFSANAENVMVVNSARTSAFNSIYGGLGIGGSFLETSAKDVKDVKANRFIGSLVLGGGKVFSNNVYVGGEFLMDFTKNNKKEVEFSGNKVTANMRGFIPQIDAKVGYAFKNDTLVYGKLGCAWSKVSLENGDKKPSKTKASFVLGLGAEKAFCKKFSAALEGDYNFGYKWQDKKDTKDVKVTCNKGWTVRALVKYNVKY